MAEKSSTPLVYVRDNAGNLFVCPIGALRDPNTLSEEEKKSCISDASDIMLHAYEGR